MCSGLAAVYMPGHLTCFSLLPESDWGHHYSLKIFGQAMAIVLIVDIVAMIHSFICKWFHMTHT